MVGRVVSLLAGYYFVQVNGERIRCRARGKLRLRDGAPCVGDMVELSLLDNGDGVLELVLPRHNMLERPLIANVTQVVVVASLSAPEPNFVLVDRVLVAAEMLGLKGVVFFNKTDLVSGVNPAHHYAKAGYQVVAGALADGRAPQALLQALKGEISVLAGQSGVGKSSLVRLLCPDTDLAVGEVSAKTKHGRHTTRHVELHYLPEYEAYIADTPGFSRLGIPADLTSFLLAELFPEMRGAREHCRFRSDCLHKSEPGCGVLERVSRGDLISKERYDSYLALLEEVMQHERSRYR